MFDFLRLAARNIQHRKKRSWLTILGTLVGILAIVALLSIGQGLENSVEQEFQQLGGDKVFVFPGGTSISSRFTSSTATLDETDLQVIENTRGIDQAAGVIQFNRRVRYGDQSEFVTVIGVPTDEGLSLIEETNNFEPTAGRFLRSADRYNIVVSENLATTTYDRDVVIRSKLKINGTDYRTVGLVEATGNVGEVILMNIESARAITGREDEYDRIAARIGPGYEPSEVEENIQESLRNHRNVEEGKEDFSTNTASDIIDSFTSQLSLIRGFLAGLAAISLLVGGVGITNTMYTSVTERTQEIGVMKAVGATKWQILRVFIYESGIIGLVGGILGTALGLLISLAASQIISQRVGIQMTPGMSPQLVIGSLTFAFLVGTLSGLLPARKAAKMNPVDALRYDK
ncbi:MAG: putative ABC transport system permease protein [Candidatus Nanohaloarchaea archaeon]|jgi:putative ABC transport system permease protein